MLKVDYEFKKGYFFIRPFGNITIKNYNNIISEIDIILDKVGVRKIVLNLDNIKSIELSCLDEILKYIQHITYNGVTMLLCDKNMFMSKRLFKNIIPSISTEMEVYNLV